MQKQVSSRNGILNCEHSKVMAGFNFIYISVVTLMPNLLFLVVKFFLHRVKHVTLDHN